MGLPQEVKSSFLALVESGNIRYEAYPEAGVTIADDADWDELFIAGAGPTVDYWLCGFQAVIDAVGAAVTQLIDCGWGGLDGATVAAANIVLTNYPVAVVWSGTGWSYVPVSLLPYPIKIPANSRMAARSASSPTGGDVIDEFRVILATVVGG